MNVIALSRAAANGTPPPTTYEELAIDSLGFHVQAIKDLTSRHRDLIKDAGLAQLVASDLRYAANSLDGAGK